MIDLGAGVHMPSRSRSVTRCYRLANVNRAYADLRAHAGNPVRAVLVPCMAYWQARVSNSRAITALLDFRRAFLEPQGARVAIDALDGTGAGQAAPAENAPRVVGDLADQLDAVQLGHRSFKRNRRTGIEAAWPRPRGAMKAPMVTRCSFSGGNDTGDRPGERTPTRRGVLRKKGRQELL